MKWINPQNTGREEPNPTHREVGRNIPIAFTIQKTRFQPRGRST